MDLTNKVFCDWDLVRFVREEQLMIDGVFNTLSVTCHRGKHDYELMLFLGKDDDGKLFEVRVYKAEPAQGYVIHDRDRIVLYQENDEFATFKFNTYENAQEFLETLSYRHPEYTGRPMEVIEKAET